MEAPSGTSTSRPLTFTRILGYCSSVVGQQVARRQCRRVMRGEQSADWRQVPAIAAATAAATEPPPTQGGPSCSHACLELPLTCCANSWAATLAAAG